MPSWTKKFLLVALLLVGQPVPARSTEESGTDLDARIAQLIEQLGDDEYGVRERAQQTLLKLGADAFDALSQAENSDDVEIAFQARYLVRLIRSDWTGENDPRDVKDRLKDYDQKSEFDRERVMKQMAQLPADEGLGPLCRLVRFEQSPVLSKLAAVLVFEQQVPNDTAAWESRTETISRVLARSSRPGANWLRAYLVAHQEPEKGLAQWVKLTDAEIETLRQQPSQTHNRLVTELLRREVGLLDDLNRPDEALAVVRKMVRVEPGDPREPRSLTELVQWLAKRKAWSVVDEVAAKFAGNFDADAMLLYTLAQARLEQGKKDLADETAAKALTINPDKSEEHFRIAVSLQERGLAEWSEREYRHVIGLGEVAGSGRLALKWSLDARCFLAENLHDEEKEFEAAELLRPAVEAMDRDPKVELAAQQDARRNPASIRSRMNFFYACHAAAAGDQAKQVTYLETGINQDKDDVDVLISLYHLPHRDARLHEKTVKMIRQTVEESRKMIDEDADERDPNVRSNVRNQLAWLVANTEGDLDEAIRCSHESIQIKRIGGYLDTLGRCYYAKGNEEKAKGNDEEARKSFENAVKYQTEAVKLEPHMRQITRQLEVLRRALEEQKAGQPKAEPKKAGPNR